MTMPMSEVTAKTTGRVISWGQIAALGVFAGEAKSGELMMRGNRLLKATAMPRNMVQARVEPFIVEGREKTAPVPPR